MMDNFDRDVQWEGVPFLALYHHDARTVRLPGLYAFVHRGRSGERTLLYVDHADCISAAAIPSHPQWSEARWHGMNEVHVCLKASERLDRLQLKGHLIKRLSPPLNPAVPISRSETIRAGWSSGVALRRAAAD